MRKQASIDVILSLRQEFVDMARQIWEDPEIADQEIHASALQRDYLARKGFIISPVEGMPTAFVAEAGHGGPIIGFLGEYDALAGLSQTLEAEKRPLTEGGPGHGCGHNLLGTGSLAAAVAVMDELRRSREPGRIRYYGCPAEETLSGKVAMARRGVFDDLSCALSWHPFDFNAPFYAGTNANYSLRFKFEGVASHAAQAPHLGRSALDALEIMHVGINYLREHVKDMTRMHYVIVKGGERPNMVPASAEDWMFLRGPSAVELHGIFERVLKIAKGAALMTETETSCEIVSACYDYLPNCTLTDLVSRNMTVIGPPVFSEKDCAMADRLAETLPRDMRTSVIAGMGGDRDLISDSLHRKIEGVTQKGLIVAGSFDLGDVSHIVPTAQLAAAAWPVGTPAHTWQSCAASGMGMGYEAMIMAAKVLAATACDILNDASILEAACEEFAHESQGVPYRSLMNV